MKTCKKCDAEKPESEFYRQPTSADGLMHKCKECARQAARENRARNAEYYREYDRWRYQNDPKVRERHLRYQQTERGAQSVRAAKSRYLDRNPVKRVVHYITGNAIRDGRLTKQPCEVCGAKQVHAHHDDYAKPLEVRWLCPKHHQEWHDKHGEGKNAGQEAPCDT